MAGRAAALILLVSVGLAAGAAVAQGEEPRFSLAQAQPAERGVTGTLRAPLVTLDRERLFAESRLGKAALARYDEASAALIAENRRLEAALEEEERALTARRTSLAPEEFRKLADEFDRKVEDLRTAQDAKSRALTRRRDEDRQAFFEAAVPVLGGLMVDLEAVAIIERSAIILTFDQLDVTDLAIRRLDAVLGDGTAPAETTGPAPDSETSEPPEADPVQP